MRDDGGEEEEPPGNEPEQKVFYAPSIHLAQLWMAAISDAIEEDAAVPKGEAALLAWLKSVATQLHDPQGRAAEQARQLLSCNMAGLARTVMDSTPPGANCMHVAARHLGHDSVLLEALSGV